MIKYLSGRYIVKYNDIMGLTVEIYKSSDLTTDYIIEY